MGHSWDWTLPHILWFRSSQKHLDTRVGPYFLSCFYRCCSFHQKEDANYLMTPGPLTSWSLRNDNVNPHDTCYLPSTNQGTTVSKADQVCTLQLHSLLVLKMFCWNPSESSGILRVSYPDFLLGSLAQCLHSPSPQPGAWRLASLHTSEQTWIWLVNTRMGAGPEETPLYILHPRHLPLVQLPKQQF